MNLERNVELEVIQHRWGGAGRLCREGAASVEGGGALEGTTRRWFRHRLRGLHRDGAVRGVLSPNLLGASLIGAEAA